MLLEWQPYMYPKIMVKKHGNQYLLINADFSDWVRLEEEEYSIFRRFKEGQSTQEILEEIQNKPEITVKEAGKMIKEVLAKLVLNQMAFKIPNPRISYHKKVSGLAEVYIAVTHQCNLSCPYCYADAGEALPHELTSKEIKSIIKDSKELGAKRIVFTGGEPLLRSNLFEMAHYAKEFDLETEFLTNGTLVNQSNIQLISEAFQSVGVSLDGSKAEIHEKLRGEGTFQKTLAGVQLLAESGLDLSINTVITRLNYRDIPNLAKLAYRFHAQAYQTHPHIPIGRGAHDNLACSFEELEEMRQILVATYHTYSKERFVRERIESNHPMKQSLREKCGTGRTEIMIDSRGDLYPCRMLQLPSCKAGNVREESLYKLYHTSQVLQYCRDIGLNELDACKGCEVENLCAGGCRALHYTFTGDLFTNDSMVCELIKAELFTNIWLKTGYYPCIRKGGYQHAL